MSGIYLITNIINGHQYVGQSIDISKRFKEHQRLYKDVDYPLYRAMRKYGVDNFLFAVIELCPPERLNDREKHWISELDTYRNGYNSTEGGDALPHKIGEENCNSKATEAEVWAIRDVYANHGSREDAYKIVEGKISRNTFQDIWRGKTWKHVHYDVYTEGNKYFYKHQSSSPYHSGLLSKEEVIYIRGQKEEGKRAPSQVYEEFKDKMTFNGFLSVWTGYSYKNIITPKNPNRPSMVKDSCGERNPAAKLTEKDVEDIRRRRDSGETRTDVYKSYKDIICRNAFYDVWNNKTWIKH